MYICHHHLHKVLWGAKKVVGTTIEGTDFSPIIATVLNRYIFPAGYQIQWHTNNSDIAILIRSDIDNGYGVLANGHLLKVKIYLRISY